MCLKVFIQHNRGKASDKLQRDEVNMMIWPYFDPADIKFFHGLKDSLPSQPDMTSL